MSRSFRKAVITDKPRNGKRSAEYWRPIRSKINQEVRNGNYEDLPNPKTIIDDYTYSDYKFKVEYDSPADYYRLEKWEKKPKEEILKEYRNKIRRK